MNTYEIEVKSLLGEEERARELVGKMCALDPNCRKVSESRQLNHYFEGGDIGKLQQEILPHLSYDSQIKLAGMIEKGKDFSVRTRQKEEQVLLVLKASVDAGSSANTVSRLEFEEPVTLTLAELDEVVQSAGFKYQAKWSREREEYAYKGLNVCLDKNAGYGYLAEFEKVLEDEAALTSARSAIEEVMQELGVAELPQDRLERMFSYYNQNWPEYYGTDRVFVIE